MAQRFRIARRYRRGIPQPEPFRIAVVLSGAVALGAYQAGVLYELLSAVERGAPLTIDVVVGSSAGALVGAITAKSLVMGSAIGTVLLKWTELTLQQLTLNYQSPDHTPDPARPLDRGILSSDAIRTLLRDYLVHESVPRSFQPAFPAPRVVFSVTLTNLDGLPGSGGPDDANRFDEAVVFRFSPPNPRKISQSPYPSGLWQRVASVVRASAAFPGAFDPEHIPWAERIRVPGLLEEMWQNEALLRQLDSKDPTLQPLMRYADGGILDERGVERAVSALPLVTGGPGEGGPETLVYDPRRCFLFIEPDPPITSAEALKAGTPHTWLGTFTRGLRLWTLSASPHTSQRRVLASNNRQEKLFRFLADLGRRMRDDGPLATAADGAREFRMLYTDPDGVRNDDLTGDGIAEMSGLIDAKLFREAIRGFYRWLADAARFQADMEWLDRLPAGRVRDAHMSIRAATVELREAYLALEGVDPISPGRYQSVLEDAHATIAQSLGLSQPWSALHQITPEDPRLMLKGEEIIHFGGFFSREFLKHDFEVGRYYAYLWLRDAVPDHVPDDWPERPALTEDGLNWRLLWRNRMPLWRMGGRFIAAMLEAIGLGYGGGGQLLVKLLGWSLILSALHGCLLLVGAWLGWISFPPQYHHFRFWLLMGTSLFPLVSGLILGLALRSDALRAARKQFGKGP
jgi:predicted acylesterase/phospholipase RssA